MQPPAEVEPLFSDDTVCEFSDEFDAQLDGLTLASIAQLSDSEMNWLSRSDMRFIIQKVVSSTSADQFYIDVLFVVSKDDEAVRKIAWLARKHARNLVGFDQ